jgi:hypothetical protein
MSGSSTWSEADARCEFCRGLRPRPCKSPPPDTKRWTARRKASVVEAVHSDIITIEEVCRCYTLSVAAVQPNWIFADARPPM